MDSIVSSVAKYESTGVDKSCTLGDLVGVIGANGVWSFSLRVGEKIGALAFRMEWLGLVWFATLNFQ